MQPKIAVDEDSILEKSTYTDEDGNRFRKNNKGEWTSVDDDETDSDSEKVTTN